MTERNLEAEMVKALEAGFNRHLNRSIVYSPFRVFFKLFKKSNPQTMERARQVVAEDILKILEGIKNFDKAIFIVKKNQITPKGKTLLTNCYNIGIRILKKDLSVMLAFKALRSEELREQIYEHILYQVQYCAARLISGNSLEGNSKLQANKESDEVNRKIIEEEVGDENNDSK